MTQKFLPGITVKEDRMRLIGLGLIISLGMGSPAALAQGAGQETDSIKGCEFCHGAQGNGSYDLIPRLNGQQSDYLMARLKEFGQVTLDTARGVNTMGHAANVDDSLRGEIANYFAHQAPTAPKPVSPVQTLGQEIYRHGIAVEKVEACESCHGPNGEGKGAIPRLAGQHASYLETRMWILSRFDLPGNGGMHRGTAGMTGEQIDSVIAYLAND
jgi:cytochrome c553